MTWLAADARAILGALGWHILLAGLPVLFGWALAIQLGRLSVRLRWVRGGLRSVSYVLRTTPTLAWLVLVPTVVGVRLNNPVALVTTLTLLSTAWIGRSVARGLRAMPLESRSYAFAVGYEASAGFRELDLPVAGPSIVSGMRWTATANVGLVALSALLGVPQLGSVILQGYRMQSPGMMVIGLVLCVLVAVAFDLVIRAVGRRHFPWAVPVEAY